MAEILGRPAPVPRLVRPIRAAGLLPFFREDREGGALYRRSLSLAPSHSSDASRSTRRATRAPSCSRCSRSIRGFPGSEPERLLFLDTETTGLGGGGGTWAFLVGLAWFDGGRVRSRSSSSCSASPADEGALIDCVRERIEACEALVTYNGKTFDLPLLDARVGDDAPAEASRRARTSTSCTSLGALHRRASEAAASSRSRARCSASCAARTSTAAKSPPVTPIFCAPATKRRCSAVVEHNAWDVASMAALVGLYGEPFDLLHPGDLVGLARTLERARALDARRTRGEHGARARSGSGGLCASGAASPSARGDRAQALADFEAFAADVDDPKVRLELAKLYEHFVKHPLRALELVEQGTGESGKQPRSAARAFSENSSGNGYADRMIRLAGPGLEGKTYGRHGLRPPRASKQRWQKYWDEHGTFRAERRPGRPKIYVLDMFPYPSGSGLHVGHPRGLHARPTSSRATSAMQRLRRAPPDGLGRLRSARRAARDQDGHAPGARPPPRTSPSSAAS